MTDTPRNEPYYVVNQNEGTDTLHRDPREVCNVDDAVGRTTVDAATGKALETSGDIRLCRHCYPATETAG
jgi:hypothetical protein